MTSLILSSDWSSKKEHMSLNTVGGRLRKGLDGVSSIYYTLSSSQKSAHVGLDELDANELTKIPLECRLRRLHVKSGAITKR